MSPTEVLALIQLFQSAIAAAPQAEELVIEAKDYIAALFSSGVISKETQDKAQAHIDEVQKAVESGVIPPEFVVDPDPE